MKASWEFSASPEEQAPSGGIVTYMRDIVGGEAVVSGDATTAEGLVAIDDHTLRIDLVRSNRLWPLEMSTSWMGVHKGHEQSKADENWADHPVGVGPFQVTYDPGTGDVDLTPAPSWWKSDPPLPSVTYHVRHVPDLQAREARFRDGEIDVALSNAGFMVQPWLRNWDHLGQGGAFFVGMPYWKVAARDRTHPDYYR